MAVTNTNTMTAHTIIGAREDLADVIYEISPTETPFLSNIAHTKARAVLHEWQTDSLSAANTANAQLEGDTITADAVTVTRRLNNRLQISRKSVSITGTLDAIDKAGRDMETSYQIAKKGRELKRDMEAILTGEHLATAGSIVSARALAGAEAWITTYTVASGVTTHTTPAYTSTPGDLSVLSDGTQGVLDETIFKSVIADVWNNGGNPGVVMCGAFNKQQISGFSGIATNFKNVPAGQATIVGAADLYVSDFGEHQIVPNRFMRARTVLFLDMDMWAVAFLRDIHQIDLAKTGDATEKALLAEYTLVCRNPLASGKIPDLTTS